MCEKNGECVQNKRKKMNIITKFHKLLEKQYTFHLTWLVNLGLLGQFISWLEICRFFTNSLISIINVNWWTKWRPYWEKKGRSKFRPLKIEFSGIWPSGKIFRREIRIGVSQMRKISRIFKFNKRTMKIIRGLVW